MQKICEHWYYTLDETLALPNPQKQHKAKHQRYHFEDNERIQTDHVDFFEVEAISGFAQHMQLYPPNVRLKKMMISIECYPLRPPDKK